MAPISWDFDVQKTAICIEAISGDKSQWSKFKLFERNTFYSSFFIGNFSKSIDTNYFNEGNFALASRINLNFFCDDKYFDSKDFFSWLQKWIQPKPIFSTSWDTSKWSSSRRYIWLRHLSLLSFFSELNSFKELSSAVFISHWVCARHRCHKRSTRLPFAFSFLQ